MPNYYIFLNLDIFFPMNHLTYVLSVNIAIKAIITSHSTCLVLSNKTLQNKVSVFIFSVLCIVYNLICILNCISTTYYRIKPYYSPSLIHIDLLNAPPFPCVCIRLVSPVCLPPDCCDASDEYNSHAHCQNTCWSVENWDSMFIK